MPWAHSSADLQAYEEVLPPGQEDSFIKVLWDRIAERLENLESEFESLLMVGAVKVQNVSSFLIIEQEAPLRARFVGDRSYFNMVVEILDAHLILRIGS